MPYSTIDDMKTRFRDCGQNWFMDPDGDEFIDTDETAVVTSVIEWADKRIDARLKAKNFKVLTAGSIVKGLSVNIAIYRLTTQYAGGDSRWGTKLGQEAFAELDLICKGELVYDEFGRIDTTSGAPSVGKPTYDRPPY